MTDARNRKGYLAEHLVERYLTEELGIEVYRPRAGATDDVGDICGIPIVVSVKNHKAYKLGEWITGLRRMLRAARLLTGVLWVKAPGKGHPRDWYVAMTGEMFMPFLKAYMEVNKGDVAVPRDEVL